MRTPLDVRSASVSSPRLACRVFSSSDSAGSEAVIIRPNGLLSTKADLRGAIDVRFYVGLLAGRGTDKVLISQDFTGRVQQGRIYV